MTYRLLARPEVESDILEAVRWYESRQNGLGLEFAQEVRQAIRSLKINPLLYRLRHKKYRVRWTLLDRFPYRIVFVVERKVITLLAVTHAKRHDRHWRQRTQSK